MSWKNGVLVRALDSQSRDSGFKTTEWVKVGTAFDSFEVDQMSAKKSCGLSCKKYTVSA